MLNPNQNDPNLPAVNSEISSVPTNNWHNQRQLLGTAPSTFKASINGQTLEAAFDVRTLLKAFQRQWLPAFGLGVVLMVVAGAMAWMFIPPSKYTTRSTLIVNTVKPKIVFDTAESTMEFSTYQRTQIALITSRMVLNAVLRDPKVAQLSTVRDQIDPLEWLEKELKVEFPGGSTVLSISLIGDNPADLAAIVNVATTKYMEMVVDQEKIARRERLNGLSNEYDKAQSRLKDKRLQLRERTMDTGPADQKSLVLKQQFDLETLAHVQRESVQNKSRLRMADIRVKLLQASQNNGQNPTNPMALESQVEPDSFLSSKIAKRDQLERAIKDLQRISRRPSDPSLTKPMAELAVVNKAISTRKNELLTRGVAPVVGSAGINPQLELESARLELNLYIQIDQGYEQEIATRLNEVKFLSLATQDLVTDTEEIALMSVTSTAIGREVEQLKLEIEAPARVRILNVAEVPKQKDDSKRIKMSGAAAVGAFALGIFGVSFWEYRTRRVYSTHEVVHSLGLNLVGTLPALPSNTGRVLSRRGQAALDRWHSLMVESIDATRTMLMHVARVEGLRAVMITSALKGEGKTSLSSHLATSLARAGLRTLLVDSDLRNPSAHKLYDLPPEPGLCELLRGELALEDAIIEVVGPSPLGTLSVLPAGRCDPQALSALAQDGMRNLLSTLKTQYDFVIVDSAPVLPVADTLLLGQQVDAVLFSILRDVSRVHHVQAAYDRLSRLGVRMLGAVINGETPSTYGSRYSYGYDYGSKIKSS